MEMPSRNKSRFQAMIAGELPSRLWRATKALWFLWVTLVPLYLGWQQLLISREARSRDAAAVRPLLKPIGFEKDRLLLISPDSLVMDPQGNMNLKAEYWGRIGFVNVGSVKADLRFVSCGMSHSREPEARGWLLDGSFPLNISNYDSLMLESQYRDVEVWAGDTQYVNVRLRPTDPNSDQPWYLHCIVLYRNDLGVYFDTYLMMQASILLKGRMVSHVDSVGNVTMELQFRGSDIDSGFSLTSPNVLSRSYKDNEAQAMEQTIDKLIAKKRLDEQNEE